LDLWGVFDSGRSYLLPSSMQSAVHPASRILDRVSEDGYTIGLHGIFVFVPIALCRLVLSGQIKMRVVMLSRTGCTI
jgi:hypothetical protein